MALAASSQPVLQEGLTHVEFLGVPPLLAQFKEDQMSWRMALSSDGLSLALLCDEVLVIRHGPPHPELQVHVDQDLAPHHRLLSWSQDDAFIAICSSDGIVQLINRDGKHMYEIDARAATVGIPLPSAIARSAATVSKGGLGGWRRLIHPARSASVVAPTNADNRADASGGNASSPQVAQTRLLQPFAAMALLPRRSFADRQWVAELLLLDYDGRLFSFHVGSPSRGKKHELANVFDTEFEDGVVTALTYSASRQLLILAHAAIAPSKSGTPTIPCHLLYFRLINEYPFFAPVFGASDSAATSDTVDVHQHAHLHAKRRRRRKPLWFPLRWLLAFLSLLWSIFFFWRKPKVVNVPLPVRCSIARSGRHAALLDTSGAVSLFVLPQTSPFAVLHDVGAVTGQLQQVCPAKVMVSSPHAPGMQRGSGVHVEEHRDAFSTLLNLQSGNLDANWSLKPLAGEQGEQNPIVRACRNIAWLSETTLMCSLWSGHVIARDVSQLLVGNPAGQPTRVLGTLALARPNLVSPSTQDLQEDATAILSADCLAPFITRADSRSQFYLLAREQTSLSNLSAYSARMMDETLLSTAEGGPCVWLEQPLAQYLNDHGGSSRAKVVLAGSAAANPAFKRATQTTITLKAVKFITPRELFQHCLDARDLNTAFSLADRFGFSRNPVYQRQWEAVSPSHESIDMVLSKITDRDWVVQECITTIPPTPEIVRKLVLHGIRLLSAHGEEQSPRYKQLCRYYWRLDTYATVYTAVERSFSADEFREFRDVNLVAAAVRFAEDRHFDVLRAIFANHPDETLPHLLPILSNVVELINPNQYKWLFPRCVESGADGRTLVVVPPTFPARAGTKAAAAAAAAATSLAPIDEQVDEELAASLPNPAPPGHQDEVAGFYNASMFKGMARFSGSPPSVEAVTEWFVRRAREFDAQTGLAENALALLRIAARNRIPGVYKLLFDAKLLQVMVFETFCDPGFQLGDLEVLGQEERMAALVATPFARLQAAESALVQRLHEQQNAPIQQAQLAVISSQRIFVEAFWKWVVPYARTQRSSSGRPAAFLAEPNAPAPPLPAFVLAKFGNPLLVETAALVFEEFAAQLRSVSSSPVGYRDSKPLLTLDEWEMEAPESVAAAAVGAAAPADTPQHLADLNLGIDRIDLELLFAGLDLCLLPFTQSTSSSSSSSSSSTTGATNQVQLQQTRVQQRTLACLQRILTAVHHATSHLLSLVAGQTFHDPVVAAIAAKAESIVILATHKLYNVQKYVAASQLLMQYDVMRMPAFFSSAAAQDEQEVMQLLLQLTRRAGRARPPLVKNDWKRLLEHLLQLQQTVFPFIPVERCHVLFAEGVLASGRVELFDLLKDVLTRNEHEAPLPLPSSRLGFDQSEALVISAAKEYFNACASPSDPGLATARACLQIITSPSEAVQAEHDLLDAIDILAEFQVAALPLQVRLSEARMEFVKSVLHSAPRAYRQPDRLVRLAQLLRVVPRWNEAAKLEVLLLVAKQAMDVGDYDLAANLSLGLTGSQLPAVWQLYLQIGSATQYHNHLIKEKLLAHALNLCDDSSIDSVFAQWSVVRHAMEQQHIVSPSRLLDAAPGSPTAPASVTGLHSDDHVHERYCEILQGWSFARIASEMTVAKHPNEPAPAPIQASLTSVDAGTASALPEHSPQVSEIEASKHAEATAAAAASPLASSPTTTLATPPVESDPVSTFITQLNQAATIAQFVLSQRIMDAGRLSAQLLKVPISRTPGGNLNNIKLFLETICSTVEFHPARAGAEQRGINVDENLMLCLKALGVVMSEVEKRKQGLVA